MPWKTVGAVARPGLEINVDYDRSRLRVGDVLGCAVRARRNGKTPVSMAIVDLGIPPGFRPDASSFADLVSRGVLAKYELTGNQCILYVRDIRPDAPLSFRYELEALYPVRAKAPRSRVYEYYTPENEATTRPVDLTVEDA